MKTIISLVAIAICSLPIFAQESFFNSTQNSNKYIVSLVPQSAAEYALRVDMERRFENGTSLIIAPRFYVRNTADWDGSNKGKLLGLGSEVFHKVRVNDLSSPLRAYFSYGFLYNFYNVTYTEREWVETITGGITTQEPVDREKQVYINKLGPSLLIGLEMEPIDRFIIDIGAGFGARYGFVSKGDKTYIDDHVTILKMGYTGILPLGVVKIGIVF